jgi:hypothetical protein
MFSAVNPFYAVVYDADGAASIRALNVAGLPVNTKIAVRDGDSECDWVLAWAPESLLDDDESKGIIRPNSVASNQPGRWTWTGEYVWSNAKKIVGVPVSTTTRTLQLADIGMCLEVDAGASAHTLTVPPNSTAAFPLHSVIHVLRKGSGTLTVAQGAGVTIRYDSTRGPTVSAKWAYGMLRKVGTDEWTWSGSIA